MALEAVYADENTGLSLPVAYHRVTGVFLHYDAGKADLRVEVYVDEQARKAGKDPERVIVQSVEGDDFTALFSATELDKLGVNTQSQAYAALKQRPEYVAAKDILESAAIQDGGEAVIK